MSELLDNRRHRMETLKELVHRLHAGEAPDALRDEFAGLLGEVGAGEVAAMESELIAEGLPAEEVQRLCDVHAAVLGGQLGRGGDVPAGHPVDTFRRDNEAIRALVAEYRDLLGVLGGQAQPEQIDRWRQLHERLGSVDSHYKRKEYLVFPFLERAGISGPPKVMWGVHDEIREQLAAAAELVREAGGLSAGERDLAVAAVLRPLLDTVEGMTDKEDRILLPMALEHLASSEWEQVRDQWGDFPPGLVEPRGFWLPMAQPDRRPAVQVPAGGAIRLPSGQLSLAQLVGLLDTLPVDVTFVDADDRVAYFSEGAERVFERNRAIIGRRVQDCHPPASVHIVEKVVEDLRSGAREVAEFWIQLRGRFVHIRYFPVRDEAGAYLGCLEMTQDVTHIRSLQGERRLLAETEGGAA